MDRIPPPVGGEEPVPPQHSLPSYDEPTPETHRRISREEEAELALGSTECPRSQQRLITVLLLLTLVALPVINLAARLRREAHGHGRPGADLLALVPTWPQIKQARTWSDWTGLLPSSEKIKAAEKNLEKESIVSQFMLPRVQSVLTGKLGAGNEQAYPGRDGWLFYRPDVDYVTGPPFLDPARLKQRARDLGLQPDPVKAIVEFHEQLAARGIRLLVLPVPAKPSVDPEMLGSARNEGTAGVLENPSFALFQRQLADRGVTLLPAATAITELRKREGGGRPLYLQTDTHWEPRTMAATAHWLVEQQRSLLEPAEEQPFQRTETQLSALGDIATMLKLPRGQKLYAPQAVTIAQVQNGNGLWRPDPSASVLLLGDSFSNIYALGAMGWGESAGFAEQLSYELRRPIDAILRNSDAAFATREMLSRELARGHDRLAGKKVVIWEFAERELMFGNWKRLPMELGQPRPARFFSTPPAAGVIVTATVAAMTTFPRPGTVPYADHIFSVHLEEIEGTAGDGNVQAVAFLYSMRNHAWTAATGWRPGDRVKLRLTPWPGAHPERESLNKTYFTESDLMLEEPVWAELVH